MRYLSGFKSRFPRPSVGTTLAFIALMVALGGTAAANLPGKNSVLTSDIKADNVKASDLKSNSVRKEEIDVDAVRASELGPITERSTTVQVVNGSQNNNTVNCNADEVVISGGNNWDTLNTGVRLQRSQRVGNGWNIAGANDSGATRTLTIIAYCLEV